jgi:hypothetical protein
MAYYKINTPFIDSVGYNLFDDKFSIKFSDGSQKKFKSSLAEYKKFIESSDKDKYFFEVIFNKIKNNNNNNNKKNYI